jgi:hypothetical protein
MVTTGPSEPFALISTARAAAGGTTGAAGRLTVTESVRFDIPSVQVTVKVVEPPTAGYQGCPGAMVELMLVDTPEASGAVIWQAVVSADAVRATVKESVEVARVKASWPFALRSIENVSANALNGKLPHKTRSIMSDTPVFDMVLSLNAVIGFVTLLIG